MKALTLLQACSRSCWKLKNLPGFQGHCAQTPGVKIVTDMNDVILPIEENGIDGKAHKESVDLPTWTNEKPMTGGKIFLTE